MSNSTPQFLFVFNKRCRFNVPRPRNLSERSSSNKLCDVRFRFLLQLLGWSRATAAGAPPPVCFQTNALDNRGYNIAVKRRKKQQKKHKKKSFLKMKKKKNKIIEHVIYTTLRTSCIAYRRVRPAAFCTNKYRMVQIKV